MSATRRQFGPYSLNTESDADILAAFDAAGDGNRIGFLRACVRLALRLAPSIGGVIDESCLISLDELALIEKARGARWARRA
jgi:hypothetical protein